jgi:DNA-directed RNA polymerase specialized sigma24 family protein
MKDKLYFKEKSIAKSYDNLEDLDVSYSTLENAFTDEKHFNAMKKLSPLEKEVLYFYEIKMLDTGKIAKITKKKKCEIPILWERAIKHFKNNLEKERS